MQKSLIDISNSLADVLKLLPDSYYTQPVPILEQQTIGQQCRHIIEHWQILVDNYDIAHINYANRNRDKTIETNKAIAIDSIIELQLKSNKKNIPLLIVSLDETANFSSSFYRELDNITEHIIHHAAIIKMAILSIDADFKIPTNFGYAPSTILYKEHACAQ